MSKGVDKELQLVDAVRQIERSIEMVTPGALVAFDGAIELGALGRQHFAGGPLSVQARSNVVLPLSAVDLDALERER